MILNTLCCSIIPISHKISLAVKQEMMLWLRGDCSIIKCLVKTHANCMEGFESVSFQMYDSASIKKNCLFKIVYISCLFYAEDDWDWRDTDTVRRCRLKSLHSYKTQTAYIPQKIHLSAHSCLIALPELASLCFPTALNSPVKTPVSCHALLPFTKAKQTAPPWHPKPTA